MTTSPLIILARNNHRHGSRLRIVSTRYSVRCRRVCHRVLLHRLCSQIGRPRILSQQCSCLCLEVSRRKRLRSNQSKAKGGVLIDADNKALESITMSNVLIYWGVHPSHYELRMRAELRITIFKTFASDMLVRVPYLSGGRRQKFCQVTFVTHCIHIRSYLLIIYSYVAPIEFTIFIIAQFVSQSQCFYVLFIFIFTFSSNSLLAGAISGGITEVGLIASGPGACNDNKFMAMVIEPGETNLAHAYVTSQA